jgi:predicted aspartyl protease
MLQVTIVGVPLKALVDTGSMHTFIHTKVVNRLGLPVSSHDGLSLLVANGDRVHSLGVCLATDVLIHEEPFSIDFVALDLGGFDLVLGIQWLHTLGPIVWDFDALSMAFWYRGRAHSWTSLGNKALAVRAIVDPRAILEELLLSYADILEEPRGLPPVEP